MEYAAAQVVAAFEKRGVFGIYFIQNSTLSTIKQEVLGYPDGNNKLGSILVGDSWPLAISEFLEKYKNITFTIKYQATAARMFLPMRLDYIMGEK